jgi:hypothetical protein
VSDRRQRQASDAATMGTMTTTLDTTFRIAALPAADLNRIRTAGIDDFGHPLRVSVNVDEAGTPLRCGLREAQVDERVALISWQPLQQARASVYAEVGPVFVHADPCPGYLAERSDPADFRHREQVLRSYSAAGDMLDAVSTDGDEAEVAIAGLFANSKAAVIHSRNVRAGCYMFGVHRLDGEDSASASSALGHVDEARVVALEGDGDRRGRAVAVLRDDEVRLARSR